MVWDQVQSPVGARLDGGDDGKGSVDVSATGRLGPVVGHLRTANHR